MCPKLYCYFVVQVRKKIFWGGLGGGYFNCQKDLTLRRSNAGDGRQDGQDGRAIGGDVFRNI